MNQEEMEIDKLFQEELAKQLNLYKIDSFEEKIVVEQEAESDVKRWRSIE